MKGKVALFLLNVIWWSPSNADPGHDHDPPKIPDRFSVRAEMIDSARKEIHSFTDTVDFEANFTRRDFVPTKAKFFRRFRQFGERPLVVIDDFATGHEFVIDRWRGNCSVLNISSQEKYNFSDKHDPFGMRRALPFLISPDFKYVKSDTLRGIPVDVFQRKVNGTIMVKFFILAHGWNELSDRFRQKTFSVPVAIEYGRYDNQTGKFVFRRTNLYDFSTDHTELALFRMEHCFNRNLSRTVEIKLKEKPAGDHLAGFDVRYAIVKNLSATMDVSFTRISHLHLGVSRGEGRPSVIFNLYEPIRAPSYLPKPAVQTSADDAIKRLQRIVEKGFSIVVPGYSGSVQRLEAEEVSVIWTNVGSEDDTVSPTPQPLTRRPEGSQAGVIAGVSLSLLVLGLAAGFGIAFAFRKRFPCDKSVPYAQTD